MLLTLALGVPSLIVPVVRPSLDAVEPLRLRALVLASAAVTSVTLLQRPMGSSDPFQSVPFTLATPGRAVFTLDLLPPGGVSLEYYVSAALDGGQTLVFPPGAPVNVQTVVVM